MNGEEEGKRYDTSNDYKDMDSGALGGRVNMNVFEPFVCLP